jgi:hypothetical protein
MKHRRTPAAHHQFFLMRTEPGRRYRDAIFAKWQCIDFKDACRIALALGTKLRRNRSDLDVSAGDRTMRSIMDDPTHCSQDGAAGILDYAYQGAQQRPHGRNSPLFCLPHTFSPSCALFLSHMLARRGSIAGGMRPAETNFRREKEVRAILADRRETTTAWIVPQKMSPPSA